MNAKPQANTPADAHEAPALDVDAILTLHRDPDGYIGFGHKINPATAPIDKTGKPKEWENLFAIRAGDMRRMLPAIRNWLAEDSYLTVNAYYRAARWQNPTTGLPDALRKERDLSRLTACYSDIDCGRPESEEPGAALEWRQAQFEASVLADRGIIPRPSIMARSGRGVYLLWLLRDEQDPTMPPRAWPNKVQLYKELNRALNARLRNNRLPADRLAIDAARVLRVPGSIHRKTGRRVEYIIELDRSGRGFVYTLPELATLLELHATTSELPESTRAQALPPAYRKTKNPGIAPLRIAGLKKLSALRADDLLTIEQWRRGFKKRGEKYDDGTTSPGRRFILMLYARFLRGAGETEEAALVALRKMAAGMRPPYPSDGPTDDPPIESIARGEYADKPRRWNNKKLCALLGIAADIARELKLRTIIPPEVAHEADLARPMQADLIRQRQDFARQLVYDFGRHLSCRDYQHLVEAAGFKKISHQTANRDLNAIGYAMRVPARGGRKRKALKGGK